VFLPGNVSVGPNTPFTVNVELNGAADAFAITPLRVKWDPAVLRLTDIAPGDLLSRSGGTVSSIKDVRNDAGEATLNVSRCWKRGNPAPVQWRSEFRGRRARKRSSDHHRDELEKSTVATPAGDAGIVSVAVQ
jgi:hypothetical protein